MSPQKLVTAKTEPFRFIEASTCYLIQISRRRNERGVIHKTSLIIVESQSLQPLRPLLIEEPAL